MRAEAARLRLWRNEPWTFVRQCLRAEPDQWQDVFLHALVGLSADGRPLPIRYIRFALQACKGPGKSTALAWAMWWFMVTRPMPKIVAASISSENLADNLWAELAKWQKQSLLLSTAFTWTQDRIYEPRNPETWFMSARAWPKSAGPEQQADTLAGIHADFVMFVLDESGGIPPGVVATAEAGLANVDAATGREALLLQAGNPTDPTGALYQAAVAHRALWHVQEITGDPDDPNRAKRVSITWAREQLEKYGRDHPWYMVNVLGRFPPGADNTLISLHDVVSAKGRKIPQEAWFHEAVVMGVDVARFGKDETAISRRQGPLVYPFECYRNLDLMAVTGHVARVILERKPDAVFVDETGLGGGVVDRLVELGHPVIGVNFGSAALESNRFANRRAEMWDTMATWTKRAVSLPDDAQLVSELPGPKYRYRSDGRLILEAKEDMVKRGLQSPNRADSLALTFAAPVATQRMRQLQGRSGTVKTQYDWRKSK